jgi:hypothetical protein
MRTLDKTLQDYDLGHLRIIAACWGLDMPSLSFAETLAHLIEYMIQESVMEEILEGLVPSAQEALQLMVHQGGQMPFSDLIRRYGPVRQMGTARRDRLKPWQNPISPVEVLWYHGLLSRAFIDTPTGPQEYAFIPSEILQHLLKVADSAQEPLGRPASIPRVGQLALKAAVDDATSLLADLRSLPEKQEYLNDERRSRLGPFLFNSQSIEMLFILLTEMEILTIGPIQPDPETTRKFLDLPREQALAHLLLAWKDSHLWNDLQHTPGLAISTEKWPNNPFSTRQIILHQLRQIPINTWWDVESLIQAIRERQPGFQRPSGDFDSWYIQDATTGDFLRGFNHWDKIDGALLSFILCGPLHWLGVTDIGKDDPQGLPSAFRLTQRLRLLFGEAPASEHVESSTQSQISADGIITIPRDAPQALRYQIARFCDWIERTEQATIYHLNPSALERATAQGLQMMQVRSILEKLTGRPLPNPLLQAIARWDQHGREAYLERTVLLRVGDSKVLERLRSNRRTARYLGEILTPTTAVVREKDWERLCSAAARSGLFIERPHARS